MPAGDGEQVSAERSWRALLGAAVCDVVPVRRLPPPPPLHAGRLHSVQEVHNCSQNIVTSPSPRSIWRPDFLEMYMALDKQLLAIQL